MSSPIEIGRLEVGDSVATDLPQGRAGDARGGASHYAMRRDGRDERPESEGEREESLHFAKVSRAGLIY